MKKYIHIVLIIISSVLSGCTQDAQLPAYNDVELSVTAQTVTDAINFDGTIVCGNRKISEKGFVFSRTLMPEYEWEQSITYEEKITVSQKEEFNAHIANIYTDPAQCTVFAYAIIDGRLYRSPSFNFNVERIAPAEITSIKIEPSAKNTDGEIIIEGKNFSIYKTKNILEVDTLLPGYWNFIPYECTPECVRLKYTCNNIGNFPLIFRKGEQKISLPQRLQINGPKFIGFKPEQPRSNEWVEVLIENAGTFDNLGCSQTNEMSVRISKTNGKWYAAFQSVPEEADLQFWYSNNAEYIYLPPLKTRFSCPWSKIHSISPTLSFSAISNGHAYSFNGENLYDYSFKNNKLEQFPSPFGLDFHTSQIKEEDINIIGDYAYICTSVFTPPSDTDERHFDLGIARFNLKTKQWEIYDRLPILISGRCNTIVCEDYILIEDNGTFSGQIIIYYPNSKTWQISSDLPIWYKNWIGEQKGYLYYSDYSNGNPTICRVKTGEWKQPEEIFHFVAPYNWTNVGQAWIEGDYIYSSGNHMARMNLTMNPIKLEPLGDPLKISYGCILPTSDEIYYVDNNGNIYRYVEDRIE